MKTAIEKTRTQRDRWFGLDGLYQQEKGPKGYIVDILTCMKEYIEPLFI